MSKILNIFLDNSPMMPSELTPGRIALCLVYTTILSLVMLMTYRHNHDSLTYNKKFNITLLMLAYTSTFLLALVQNNPLLSLGVLGSLSICRVRTNTKDPRDIGYVFWALAIGIASAVGAFFTGLVSFIILALILVFLNDISPKKDGVLIVIRGSIAGLEETQKLVEDAISCSMYSKNISIDSFELVYEIPRINDERTDIIQSLNAMDWIHGVNILAPESRPGQ